MPIKGWQTTAVGRSSDVQVNRDGTRRLPRVSDLTSVRSACAPGFWALRESGDLLNDFIGDLPVQSRPKKYSA
jgi:hypothetical protein